MVLVKVTLQLPPSHSNASAAEIWGNLADFGYLPPLKGTICGSNPLVRWGWVRDGTFFVLRLEKTMNGFEAVIQLEPDSGFDPNLLGWILQNLFRGVITEYNPITPTKWEFSIGYASPVVGERATTVTLETLEVLSFVHNAG